MHNARAKLSPRPLLIIHRRNERIISLPHAYELERHAGQPKMLVVAEERMHMDSDSFFSSCERRDEAIKLTLDWLKKST